MKKIYVQAYCQSNLGDDLFVLQLAKKYPLVRFYLYAVGTNQRAFRKMPNIALPSLWDRICRKGKHLLHRQSRFDGVGMDGTVTIGGSILWEGAPLYFGEEGKPRFLIGANCEKSYSSEFRRQLEEALSHITGCCFRDQASYVRFLGLPNVTWAPDVLFDYAPKLPKQKGQGIGISVVSRKGVFQNDTRREAYYTSIAQLCDLCLANDIPVRLLSFCQPEGDEEAIAAILQQVSQPGRVQISTYRGNPVAVLADMNACETIVATRFHAMILGWVLGKNVVPVVYSTKQTQVLSDCGFCGPMWNALEGDTVSGAELFEYIREGRGKLDISDLKEKSRAQFFALDEYLR